MKVTSVKINLKYDRRLLAYVSFVLNDAFAVHNCRLIDGPNGMFLAMPQRQLGNGDYVDVAHPIKQELRADIERSVIRMYREMINPGREEKRREDARFVLNDAHEQLHPDGV